MIYKVIYIREFWSKQLPLHALLRWSSLDFLLGKQTVNSTDWLSLFQVLGGVFDQLYLLSEI